MFVSLHHNCSALLNGKNIEWGQEVTGIHVNANKWLQVKLLGFSLPMNEQIFPLEAREKGNIYGNGNKQAITFTYQKENMF